MTTELFQQTLDALIDSLDCVQTEYAICRENYGDYPNCKAHIDMLKSGVEKHKAAIKALEVAIAQLDQQAVFPSGLVEILREAANIINAIDIAHAPANIRWPIVDELDGFSLMVAQPEQPATVQGEPVATSEAKLMLQLAESIAASAHPEEDSRLEVAYSIARHLKLDWPSAVQSDYEIRHWAEEYECAMKCLDDAGAPKADSFKTAYSLWGRIKAYTTPQPADGDAKDALINALRNADSHIGDPNLLNMMFRLLNEAADMLTAIKKDEWKEAVLDALAVACLDAPQDETPRSIIHRLIARHIEIVLDPSVSDQAQEGDAKDAERPLDKLIAAHAQLIENGNDYAYFELAYTRQTGWMAWLTDKPLCGPVVNPDRKVIAIGQGNTPDEAAIAAIASQKGLI